jgi:hypothetical protein
MRYEFAGYEWDAMRDGLRLRQSRLIVMPGPSLAMTSGEDDVHSSKAHSRRHRRIGQSDLPMRFSNACAFRNPRSPATSTSGGTAPLAGEEPPATPQLR